MTSVRRISASSRKSRIEGKKKKGRQLENGYRANTEKRACQDGRCSWNSGEELNRTMGRCSGKVIVV